MLYQQCIAVQTASEGQPPNKPLQRTPLRHKRARGFSEARTRSVVSPIYGCGAAERHAVRPLGKQDGKQGAGCPFLRIALGEPPAVVAAGMRNTAKW